MRYSNSATQKYKTCPLSFYHKYVANLERLEEGAETHHLSYGAAMHAALKLLYLGDTLEAAKKAFVAEYPKQLDETDLAKTQPHGLIVLDAYTKRWATEDKKWKILSCEEHEVSDFAEGGFNVVLDLVMENKEFGGVYGFDHKVVGGKKATLSYDFWNQFEPNSQLTRYISHIESKYKLCSGFYINAIGMGHRQKKYKEEPAGFWYRFERQMFNRRKEQVEQEREDTAYWIERIEQSRVSNRWGMNTEACRFCEYRPICAAGWTWPDDEELILGLYKQKAPRVSAKEKVDESVG